MDWESATDSLIGQTLETFGKSATYLARSGESYPIRGVYSAPFVAVSPGGQVVNASERPEFGIRLMDLPVSPEPGDRVAIGETAYFVAECHPDGEGGATLVLSEVDADEEEGA